MFGNFSFEARKVLIDAKKEMYDLKHPYVGSEHMLLAILNSNNEVKEKLTSLGITYKIFKDEIIKVIGVGNIESKCLLYTPLLRRIIENATQDSKEDNNEVTITTLFSNLLEEGEGVAIRLLLGLNIDIDKLYSDFSYKIVKSKKIKNKKLMIDEVGNDLTKKAKNNELDPCIARDKEIKRMIEILLRKNKNNPILIGEAGVGKTAIVEGLAVLIANNNIPLSLKNKKIISIDMATLVAGTKYRGEFEEKIRKLLNEVEDNSDIILFIDEIHTIVGAGGAEGAIDASNIFKPVLARNKIKVIGATTTLEYKKFIESDKALDRRFQKVIIEEPTQENLKEIIFKLKPIYEKYHNVILDNDIIELILKLSNRYIFDRYNPDKTIDILDEVCACVSLKENKYLKEYNKYNNDLMEIIDKKNLAIKKNKYKDAIELKKEENKLESSMNNLELKLTKNIENKVKKEDVIKVISEKSHIPLYEILEDNNKILSNIENDLKKNIIGQDNAINKVMEVVKKMKLGYKDGINSFIFIGPSGVGKTCMAKLISKNLSNHLIRLDMSEYQESYAISKIIGSPAGYVGYNDNLNVLEEVRNNPYSIILLDEIEKANEQVINLFYQILDEGIIKDSVGRTINFKNTILIMTSNIGYEINNIGFNGNNTTQLNNFFSKAFLNRIDNIIYFNYLKENDIDKIIKEKISIIRKKYNGRRVYIKKDTISLIKEKSEYHIYGARRLEKLIKDNIENTLINEYNKKQTKLLVNQV